MQIINKKDIPETLTVKIEKMSNLGFGIAKYEGYVIFIPYSCVGDVLKIKLNKKNKSYAYADIVEIVEPSKYRVEPFCKMQKVCGACQFQHIDYEAQLKIKKQIVEDAMQSIYGDSVEIRDVIKSPKDRAYRYKIQYPITQTKDSKRIIAGYYKSKSHDLVNIKYCPIQPSYCDDIIEFIRKACLECGVTGYDESRHTGELRHVVIRTSSMNSQSIVVLVVNAKNISNSISDLAHRIYVELQNIAGVSINFNDKITNLILGNKTLTVEGKEFVEETLCDKTFKIAPKTFFQVNPMTADNIFKYVKNYIFDNFKKPIILDAYAGITAFGICLSDIASKVVSIEEEEASVKLAQSIIEENNIDNIELNCGDAGEFFANQTSLGRLFDVTILDPPRKGCTQNCLDYAMKLTKSVIIYVSCNPATLARDLKYLKGFGADIKYIQPFDMFPHTYHIENVAIIEMQKTEAWI